MSFVLLPSPRWTFQFKSGYFGRVPWIDETDPEKWPESMVNEATRALNRFMQSSVAIDTQVIDQTLHDQSTSTSHTNIIAAMRTFSLDQFIYFSNQIEDSGLDLDNTRAVVVSILTTTPLTNELVMSCKERKNTYGRQEVEQHAAAYKHLCIDNITQPLTVELIKDTHCILMQGLPVSEHKLIDAGQYRNSPVFVGHQRFIADNDVPSAVRALCHNFRFDSQSDVEWDDTEQDECRRDPYSLAAQLCHDFVCIHPFEDGNGRMCR